MKLYQRPAQMDAQRKSERIRSGRPPQGSGTFTYRNAKGRRAVGVRKTHRLFKYGRRRRAFVDFTVRGPALKFEGVMDLDQSCGVTVWKSQGMTFDASE